MNVLAPLQESFSLESMIIKVDVASNFISVCLAKPLIARLSRTQTYVLEAIETPPLPSDLPDM